MELKVKYQYTYFIKPFLIEEKKYEKYLQSLIKNKNYKLKFFEKERDLNLYTYFIKSIREYFFPTFEFDKEKIRDFNSMIDSLKAKKLAELHCNIFEYNLNTRVQGKIDEKEGIFFNIDKIELICLDTGVCFLLIKTNLENSEKFSELLNFNYKFKDINSEFSKLKEFNNIKIQTDKFDNMNELSDFIDDILGVKNNYIELKDVDLYNKRFFVYAYSCIDQDAWNSEEDFTNIESAFFRYSNVLSNNNTVDLNLRQLDKNMQSMEQFKYARFGFTKQSTSLITSSIDINNYTKLLFDYENEYLYTLIISLYQRICLKKLENSFETRKNFRRIRNKFSYFTKKVWLNEITNSLTGTIFYNKCVEVFELEEIYNTIKNKYDIIYKNLDIEKNSKANKVICFILLISILLNVFNLITMLKLK
jgi:hypothetical protein